MHVFPIVARLPLERKAKGEEVDFESIARGRDYYIQIWKTYNFSNPTVTINLLSLPMDMRFAFTNWTPDFWKW